MQSGSFVNLSRQRKEQAAARALQEQQAAAAAAAHQQQHDDSAVALGSPLEQVSFGQQQQQQAYQQQYQQSPYHAPQSASSYLGATGSTGSSVTSSPLASPPSAGGVTSGSSSFLGTSLSPGLSDPLLASPQDFTLYPLSAGNGSGVLSGSRSNGSSLVRRHHTVGSRPQKYLSATQKERVDEEDADGSSRAAADDVDDAASTSAFEGSVDSHGGPFAGVHGLGPGGLARAGSLPSKPSGASQLSALTLLEEPA